MTNNLLLLQALTAFLVEGGYEKDRCHRKYFPIEEATAVLVVLWRDETAAPPRTAATLMQ
jgi:hypothetical protein